jgi:hypothetical protein
MRQRKSPNSLPSGSSTLQLGEQQPLSGSQVGTTTIALKIKWPTRQRTSRWMPDAAHKLLRKTLERSSQPSALSLQTTVSLGRSDFSFRPEAPTGRRHRAIDPAWPVVPMHAGYFRRGIFCMSYRQKTCTSCRRVLGF